MKHLIWILSLTLLLALACSTPTDAPTGEDAAVGEGEYLDDAALDLLASEDCAPDRVLIGFDDAVAKEVQLADQPLTSLRRWDSIGVGLYQLSSDEDLVSVIRQLRATGEFAFVEPDLSREASAVPNDPYYADQWHLQAVNAAAAWDIADGSGAVVAVIDTGVTPGADDGINALVAGYDFVNGDADPADDNGHGTHVSGTVAQATDNGVGVAGLAHGAAVMPIKVLGADGSGYSSDVIDGIVWATDNGADVINLSLSSTKGSTAEQDACDYAYAQGVLVTAAAGNAGRRKAVYPAGYSSVIGVGATDYANERSYYSNRGPHVELVAPGGDVTEDLNGDGYADGVLQETFDPTWGYYFWQGTSMATPHVAAAAALLSSMGATNTEIRDILRNTAVDLDAAGWDQNTGYGLIDAAAAVASYAPPVDDDGDGYSVAGGDCDDTDATVNPGATEVWYDGVDQDCDGASDYDQDVDGYDSDLYGGTDCDDLDPDVVSATTWYLDGDLDGYGDGALSLDACSQPAGYVDNGDDCDDADDTVFPGAAEICDDGIDQDCDGADETCGGPDTTPPVISSVNPQPVGKNLTVSWETDEPATGELCNAKGSCAATPLGTVHSATVGKKGGTFTITATDEAGNSSTYGPAAY